MDQDKVEVHKNTHTHKKKKKKKKERGQYPTILTEQAWADEGFIIWPKEYTQIVGTKQAIPSGQHRPIF